MDPYCMRSIVNGVFAYCILAVGCERASPQPKPYTNDEGCFSVSLEGKLEPKLIPGRFSSFLSFTYQDPFHEKFVAYGDVPPGGDAEQMLNAFVLGMNKGARTPPNSIPFILQGRHPGRECLADIPGEVPKKAKSRVFLVEGRIYMVCVVGIPSYVDGPETAKFLDSFKVDDVKLKKLKSP